MKLFIQLSAMILAAAATVTTFYVCSAADYYYQSFSRDGTVGPIFIPSGNDMQVYWYTDIASVPKLSSDKDPEICTQPNYQSSSSCTNSEKHHSALISTANWVDINSSRFKVPKPSSTKFNVVSDIHTQTKYTWKLDGQLTLAVGDFCNGEASDYIQLLDPFRGQLLLPALGNHDTYEEGGVFLKSLLNRDTNYAQRYGNIVFITLDFVTKDFEVTKQFLLAKLRENTQASHIFIQSHYQAYSTGEFRTNQERAQLFEQIVDSNEFSNIRAIFTGHDHVFAAFKYKSVYQFVVGTAGVYLDTYATDPWWGGRVIKGDVSQHLYGGQYHLASYMQFGALKVEIEEGKQIKYSYYNMENDTDVLVDSFTQSLI